MSALVSLSLLAVTAGAGIHLEEVGELPLEDAVSVVSALARALEGHRGEPAVIDDPSWSQCEARDRCVQDLRGRTQAEELVFVRVFGGPSLIHVILERVSLEARENRTFELDLERVGTREPGRWTGPLARAVGALFPEAGPPKRSRELSLAEPGPAPEPRERSLLRAALPWIALGAGAACGGAGVYFGTSSADAKEELESGIFLGGEYDALSSRLEGHGLAANVLFGAAAGLVVTGVVLFLVD